MSNILAPITPFFNYGDNVHFKRIKDRMMPETEIINGSITAVDVHPNYPGRYVYVSDFHGTRTRYRVEIEDLRQGWVEK